MPTLSSPTVVAYVPLFRSPGVVLSDTVAAAMYVVPATPAAPGSITFGFSSIAPTGPPPPSTPVPVVVLLPRRDPLPYSLGFSLPSPDVEPSAATIRFSLPAGVVLAPLVGDAATYIRPSGSVVDVVVPKLSAGQTFSVSVDTVVSP